MQPGTKLEALWQPKNLNVCGDVSSTNVCSQGLDWVFQYQLDIPAKKEICHEKERRPDYHA